jgi:hypothetical protein
VGTDAAGAILLAALTGQNPTVILKVPAVYHRADGYSGVTGTAIVGLNKRRRGPRAHMSLALAEVPDWISIPGNPGDVPARDMLHTPFGVYLLPTRRRPSSCSARGHQGRCQPPRRLPP